MVESQSRYGIMEEINEKKLKAQTELANMEKDKVIKEMECRDEMMKIHNQINITKSSFEAVHKNNVLYEKMKLSTLFRILIYINIAIFISSLLLTDYEYKYGEETIDKDDISITNENIWGKILIISLIIILLLGMALSFIYSSEKNIDGD